MIHGIVFSEPSTTQAISHSDHRLEVKELLKSPVLLVILQEKRKIRDLQRLLSL